jgi:transposase
MKEPNRSVTIGLDAAVVADHQVAIRGDGIRENFRVAPTLAGMRKLTERLSPYAGALVVAEPTGGTWLPLSYAIADAGCELGLVQMPNRDR